MTPIPADFLIKACKNNAECGLRAVEILVEGATKIRELQLQAATDAHAGTVAAQKCIAAAGDPTEMWRHYGEWMLANGQKSVAYWQAIAQTLMETNAAVLKSVAEGAQALPGASGAGDADATKQALAGLIDNAYKQWLDATRGFYSASASLPFAALQPQRQFPTVRPSA